MLEFILVPNNLVVPGVQTPLRTDNHMVLVEITISGTYNALCIGAQPRPV